MDHMTDGGWPTIVQYMAQNVVVSDVSSRNPRSNVTKNSFSDASHQEHGPKRGLCPQLLFVGSCSNMDQCEFSHELPTHLHNAYMQKGHHNWEEANKVNTESTSRNDSPENISNNFRKPCFFFTQHGYCKKENCPYEHKDQSAHASDRGEGSQYNNNGNHKSWYGEHNTQSPRSTSNGQDSARYYDQRGSYQGRSYNNPDAQHFGADNSYRRYQPRICYEFQKGRCDRGENCRFDHVS